MTWNSACSIASDDENSRQSFLSDCDSEFDLRPPPRYPAEKRTYAPWKKQSISPVEPPMTRSRAKAIGKTIPPPEPLPTLRRRSAVRRSIDAFTGMASTLSNSLNTTNNHNNNNNNNNSNGNDSILFPKQEPTMFLNDRLTNAPLDGVNVLADRFESCSLDEEKLNKYCLWPSRETNSRYMRPITTPSGSNAFGSTSFSTSNNSNIFTQSSTPVLFGQQQAQLWSRFRFAASSLRNNNLWLEQTDLTLQQVPSTLFPTHPSNNHQTFYSNHQSTMLLSPQTVPNRLVTSQNQPSPSSLIDESSASSTASSTYGLRKVTSPNELITSSAMKENVVVQQSTRSKLCFTFTIFIFGLVLGYLLTNTLPPVLLWETFVKYIHICWIYVQVLLEYVSSLRFT